ncbi:MAG: SUMF1/EgtB/PvdO family nonheme iron enzyme, partial [Elusimicrobia bacterium]|nr:SUMF1/EgtB/PvdO family nonheme iron enzyme [Elusimicrobiota bacterium]
MKTVISLAAALCLGAASSPSSAAPASPIAWVAVQGGAFTMGAADGYDDEAPPHRVEVADFQLSRTLVTVAQYAACVDAGRCSP